jgi:hypothetical protein
MSTKTKSGVMEIDAGPTTAASALSRMRSTASGGGGVGGGAAKRRRRFDISTRSFCPAATSAGFQAGEFESLLADAGKSVAEEMEARSRQLSLKCRGSETELAADSGPATHDFSARFTGRAKKALEVARDALAGGGAEARVRARNRASGAFLENMQ